jgi:hypothetical protein
MARGSDEGNSLPACWLVLRGGPPLYKSCADPNSPSSSRNPYDYLDHQDSLVSGQIICENTMSTTAAVATTKSTI